MCLTTVTKRYKRVSSKVRYGYKLFRNDDGFLLSLYNGGGIIKENSWTEARGTRIAGSSGGAYPAGFHAFEKLDGAEAYRRSLSLAGFIDDKWKFALSIRRVALRRVETIGIQAVYTGLNHINLMMEVYPAVVFVAREMRVPKGEQV